MKIITNTPIYYNKKTSNSSSNAPKYDKAFGMNILFRDLQQRIVRRWVLENGGTTVQADDLIQTILGYLTPENIDKVFTEVMATAFKDRIQALFPQRAFESITPRDVVESYDQIEREFIFSVKNDGPLHITQQILENYKSDAQKMLSILAQSILSPNIRYKEIAIKNKEITLNPRRKFFHINLFSLGKKNKD